MQIVIPNIKSQSLILGFSNVNNQHRDLINHPLLIFKYYICKNQKHRKNYKWLESYILVKKKDLTLLWVGGGNFTPLHPAYPYWFSLNNSEILKSVTH